MTTLPATDRRPSTDPDPLRTSLLYHARYSLGAAFDELSARERFHALALAARDVMVERLLQTEQQDDALRTV